MLRFIKHIFITNLQSIPPLLKHIFVTFLPSREKQINSLLLETLINSAAKITPRRILISRKHFLNPRDPYHTILDTHITRLNGRAGWSGYLVFTAASHVSTRTCGDSLEVLQSGSSDEYPQQMFLWRILYEDNKVLIKLHECSDWACFFSVPHYFL